VKPKYHYTSLVKRPSVR